MQFPASLITKKEATNGNWPLRPIDHTHRFPKKGGFRSRFYFLRHLKLESRFAKKGELKAYLSGGVKVAASLSIFQTSIDNMIDKYRVRSILKKVFLISALKSP